MIQDSNVGDLHRNFQRLSKKKKKVTKLNVKIKMWKAVKCDGSEV